MSQDSAGNRTNPVCGGFSGARIDDLLKKAPPHRLDVERAILGIILLFSNLVSKKVSIVHPDSFYDQRHAIVFRTMISMIDRGEPIDPITLKNSLFESEKGKGKVLLEREPAFLDNLADGEWSPANLDQYIEILNEMKLRRDLILEAFEISYRAQSGETTAGEEVESYADTIEEIKKRLTKIGLTESTGKLTPLGDLCHEALKTADAMATGTEPPGILTHFEAIDKRTGGLHPKELNLLAARPAEGKSSLALNIAFNISWKNRLPVLFVSLEMSKESLIQRLLCSLAKIPVEAYRRGIVNEEQCKKLAEISQEIWDIPLYLEYDPSIRIAQIYGLAESVRDRHNKLGLIVIDYIQLLSGSKKNYSNDTALVTELSRGLKILAGDQDCPVLALSQLNRQLENRPDKRPKPSDLRESGSLEQDADTIMFLFHGAKRYESCPEDQVELILSKQRNGPTGTSLLRFRDQYTLFEDWF